MAPWVIRTEPDHAQLFYKACAHTPYRYLHPSGSGAVRVGSGVQEGTCIGRRAIEAIKAAIDISDRGRRQFLDIDVVEQGNLDRVEGAAQLSISPRPGVRMPQILQKWYSTVGPGRPRWRPMVLGSSFGARRQTIAARWDEGEPGPRLGATRAVAFHRSLDDVDVGFEADSAALATAGIGIQGQCWSFQFDRRNSFDDSCAPITFDTGCEIRVSQDVRRLTRRRRRSSRPDPKSMDS